MVILPRQVRIHCEGGIEGICDKRRTGDHMITHFNTICVTLRTLREYIRII